MSADSDVKEALRLLCGGLPVNPVPPPRHRDETLPHAPTRTPVLNAYQQKVRGTTDLYKYSPDAVPPIHAV